MTFVPSVLGIPANRTLYLNALLMIMANTGVGGTSSRLARAADLPRSQRVLMMMLFEMPFRIISRAWSLRWLWAGSTGALALRPQRSVCLEAKGLAR